jgi:hypothetical protein
VTSGVGVGSGVTSGVGVGSGVASGVGVGSGVGVASLLGDGSADSGGHGTATTSEPDGDGISTDGMTPLASGVGSGMQLGDGLGSAPQPSRSTYGPHVRPYGVKALL